MIVKTPCRQCGNKAHIQAPTLIKTKNNVAFEPWCVDCYQIYIKARVAEQAKKNCEKFAKWRQQR